MVPVSFHFLKRQRGLTLIEIMLVIVLLGVLTTSGLASYVASQRLARDNKRKTDLQVIAQALEQYKSEHGVYPSENFCDSSLGAITACGCKNTDPHPISCPVPGTDWSAGNSWDGSPGTFIWQNLVGPPQYISRLPVDPQNTTSQYYYYEPACNGTQPGGLCGQNPDCTNKGCCAYELGAHLELPNTWYTVCSPGV